MATCDDCGTELESWQLHVCPICDRLLCIDCKDAHVKMFIESWEKEQKEDE